jgi:CO/xanthine dehydrogenase FAD-binding subunit
MSDVAASRIRAAATCEGRGVSPRTLKQALHHLARDPDVVPVAGCTDLMVCAPEERLKYDNVLDLTRIRELRKIKHDDTGWTIGAAVTFSEIRRSRKLRGAHPILAEAASQIGGWQIQNRATLGGNMANASPAGDSLPVLLALDAVVVAVGPEGRREIPFSAFIPEYRRVDLRRGEIIGWVRLPDPAAGSVQKFKKVGTREAQAISKVAVAMSAAVAGGVLTRVRFGVGSVAAVPVRLTEVERLCEGQAMSPELAARAAQAAMDSVRPIDDVRSTADYRRAVLGRVVRRMLSS